jgi:hypothetical protein
MADKETDEIKVAESPYAFSVEGLRQWIVALYVEH